MPLWPSDWFSRSRWCSRPQVHCRRAHRDLAGQLVAGVAHRLARGSVSRSSTTLSVSASSHHWLSGWRSRLLTTATQRWPPSGHSDSGQLVVEGQPQHVAPDHVEVRRGRRVRRLGEVPVEQQPLARRRSTPRSSAAASGRAPGRGRSGCGCSSCMRGHVARRRAGSRPRSGVGEQVAGSAGCGSRGPAVVGEVPPVARPGDGLVGGDDEALGRVEHVRQLVERHVAAASSRSAAATRPPGSRRRGRPCGSGSLPAPGSRCCRRCRRTRGSGWVRRTLAAASRNSVQLDAASNPKIASAVGRGVSAVHASATAYPFSRSRRIRPGRRRWHRRWRARPRRRRATARAGSSAP